MVKTYLCASIFLTFITNTWCASLEDNGNGTVTDYDTGLIWQQNDNDVTRTWWPANDYCTELSLAGRTDWKLPNVKELVSIIDHRSYEPAIDDAMFPATKTTFYWSASSVSVNGVASAWRVEFFNGNAGRTSNTTNNHYVRCVREG